MKLKVTKDEYFKMISTPEHDKWFKDKMSELGFDDNKYLDELFALSNIKNHVQKITYNSENHESINSIEKNYDHLKEFEDDKSSFEKLFKDKIYENDYENNYKNSNEYNFYGKSYSSNGINENKIFNKEKRYAA